MTTTAPTKTPASTRRATGRTPDASQGALPFPEKPLTPRRPQPEVRVAKARMAENGRAPGGGPLVLADLPTPARGTLQLGRRRGALRIEPLPAAEPRTVQRVRLDPAALQCLGVMFVFSVFFLAATVL